MFPTSVQQIYRKIHSKIPKFEDGLSILQHPIFRPLQKENKVNYKKVTIAACLNEESPIALTEF